MTYGGIESSSSGDVLLNFYDGSELTCAKSDFVGNEKFQFSNSNVQFVHNDMSHGGIGSSYAADALLSFYDGSGFTWANSDFVGNDKFQFNNSNVEFVKSDMSYSKIGSNSFGDASFNGGSRVDILDFSGTGFTCANTDFVGNDKFQFSSSNLEFINPLDYMSYANYGSSSFSVAMSLLYDGSSVNISDFPDDGFTVPKK